MILKTIKNHKIYARWYDLTDKKWKDSRTLQNGVVRIGKHGHKIGAITMKTDSLLWYRSYQKGSEKWGKHIIKYGTKAKEYAGNKKRSITAFAVKCNKVAFAAHLLNKDIWLPIVYGDEYDLQDFQYGYAGDKKHTIDIIDIWRTDVMPNFSDPVNPVGSGDPCYNTNLYGASWTNNWNTCIYGSPMQTGANVLSNCTGYAQGRALEIYREIHPNYNPATLQTHLFATLNGEPDSWISRARTAGLTISDEPREGSILCTQDHVAIVEKYVEGQGWWISESGYGNTTPWHFWYELGPGVPDLYSDSSGNWYSAYSSPSKLIDGFILIPDVIPGPGPTPGPHRLGYDRRRRYRNC